MDKCITWSTGVKMTLRAPLACLLSEEDIYLHAVVVCRRLVCMQHAGIQQQRTVGDGKCLKKQLPGTGC